MSVLHVFHPSPELLIAITVTFKTAILILIAMAVYHMNDLLALSNIKNWFVRCLSLIVFALASVDTLSYLHLVNVIPFEWFDYSHQAKAITTYFPMLWSLIATILAFGTLRALASGYVKHSKQA